MAMFNRFSSKLDATSQDDFGNDALIPNSPNDQSAKLQNIVNQAFHKSASVYIPQGVYIINSSVTLPETYQISGETGNDPTILRNTTTAEVMLVRKNYHGAKDCSVENIIFDSVSYNAILTTNLHLSGCIFCNPIDTFPVNITASNNVDIINNLFMRDAAHATPGNAYNHCLYIAGFSTSGWYIHMENVRVNGNIFGLKLNELQAIKSFSKEGTVATIERLEKALKQNRLPTVTENEQNYISCGINSYSMLKNATLMYNLFYFNYDNSDTRNVTSDHAIYFRGSQKINVVANHIRAINNGPGGGIKFKSGKDIVVMNNYFRNTGIIISAMKEYGLGDSYSQGPVSLVSQWLVANNRFDWKHWEDSYAIGIVYTRDNGDDNNVHNGVFIENTFTNYHNIPSNRRRNLLIASSEDAGNGGFRGKTTYVKNNRRDDSNTDMTVEFWTDEEYKTMPQNWQSIMPQAIYDQFIHEKMPVRNAFPVAVPATIHVGDSVNALSLVAQINDQDEEEPQANILNPQDLQSVGKKILRVQLTYADESVVVINVPVNIVHN